MRQKLVHAYDSIISVENLLIAWKEFKNGKRNKEDVALFERNLMDNIFILHHDLVNKTYQHAGYHAFKISDPKPRDIHKTSVRDRLLHHAIYRQIYWFFDRKFIHDSYSCRKNKGTYAAVGQFKNYARKVNKNNTKQCFVLKCDIKKFFASVDLDILKGILRAYISDTETILLLENIIQSFPKGLPLGNLTSQLLVNVYMNEFDQFIKHKLKVKYYIRYADDFVVLSGDKKYLEDLLPKIRDFLSKELKLDLHPGKVFIK